jgi:hypothetical protein
MKYKEIPGFSKYGISESGEVKNLETGRIRKSRILKKYVHIALFSYSGKRKGFYIHQLVAMTYLGHEPCGYDRVVDHIDNDKLNNHVSNLQIISQRENSSKDKFRYNPTSQYTGVNWHKGTQKWRARIVINGKKKHIGLFATEEQAAEAYELALQTSIYTLNN